MTSAIGCSCATVGLHLLTLNLHPAGGELNVIYNESKAAQPSQPLWMRVPSTYLMIQVVQSSINSRDELSRRVTQTFHIGPDVASLSCMWYRACCGLQL